MQEFFEYMAILPAIIGAAGTLLGAGVASAGAKKTNEQSIDFSKEAAQNKHQWQVEDLKKAGLNPILSSTLGGSQASQPSLVNPGEAWKDASGKAMQSAASAMQLDKIEAEVKNIEQSAATSAAQQSQIEEVTKGQKIENDMNLYKKGLEEKKYKVLDGIAGKILGLGDTVVDSAKNYFSDGGNRSGSSIVDDKPLELQIGDRKKELADWPPDLQPRLSDPLYKEKMKKVNDFKKRYPNAKIMRY